MPCIPLEDGINTAGVGIVHGVTNRSKPQNKGGVRRCGPDRSDGLGDASVGQEMTKKVTFCPLPRCAVDHVIALAITMD